MLASVNIIITAPGITRKISWCLIYF